jgi:predicted DNA-binding protein
MNRSNQADRPRRTQRHGAIRVELRLDRALAERLYALANDRGVTISLVGSQALETGLTAMERGTAIS